MIRKKKVVKRKPTPRPIPSIDTEVKKKKKVSKPSGKTSVIKRSSFSKKKKAAAKSSRPSFMKRGKAAQAALAAEQKKADVREKQRGKMWRYYMKEGTTHTITFLDGSLDEDGILDVFIYPEHHMQIGGNWRNWFVCTSEQEEICPLCQEGDEPSLVGVLTIIDHTPYVDRKNKTHKNRKQLYVFKRRALVTLQKLATAYKGLRGCQFEVSRSSDTSVNTGDVFIFKKKFNAKTWKQAYPGVNPHPANYDEEITYVPAKDLIEMGFGTAGIGSEGEITDDDWKDDDIPF